MIDEVHEKKERIVLYGQNFTCSSSTPIVYIGEIYTADLISEVESNTCVKFKYVPVNTPHMWESQVCNLPYKHFG